MADGIVIQGGAVTVAADEIAGAQVQRVKVQTGADGSATDVSNAAPLPVSDAGGSLTVDGTVGVSGTVAAAQSGAWSQRNQDGNGTAITSSATGTNSAKQALDVSLPSKLDTTTLTITPGSGTRTFGTIDTLGYVWLTAGFVATGSAMGGMMLQGSHDNTTWFGFPVEAIPDGGAPISTFSSYLSLTGTASTYSGPLSFRYLRAQTTGTVTGTYVIQVALTATALAKNIITVNGSVSDNDQVYTFGGSTLPVIAGQYGYNGGITGNGWWVRVRTPSTFKTITATVSGDSVLWTPTAGKKFRLMRYMIQVTADASITASGQVVDIVLRDATTGTAASFSQYVPGTAATTFGNSASTGWIDLGNGILGAAANNVLNVNLSATLSTGKVRVVCAGVEE